MNNSKRLVIFSIMIAILLCLVGCRNNLVNNWENYTGDTDVYYTLPTETELQDSTQDMVVEGELMDYGIPDYWKEELERSVETVTSTIKGNRHTAFFWYTDAHWSYGSEKSVAILQYLEDHTAIRYTNYGGDIVNTYDVDEQENRLKLEQWRESTLKLTNHHSVVGNHDDDIPQLSSKEDLYEFLIAPELDEFSNPNNSFDYYVDDSSQNTRYVYLSTGLEETSVSTMTFLVQTLTDTPRDWHIVLISHIWFTYFDSAAPTIGEIPAYADSILNLADAYNNRDKGKSDEDILYDFSSCLARVEFCVGGHTHVDFDFRTKGGIPVILTETDSYHTRGTAAEAESVTEASVSVIIADYDEGDIYVVRVGRGEDRIVPIQQ